MPFAVHIFFDEKTDQAIRSIWQEMTDSGVAPYLGVSGNRPHISLALCDDLDPGDCERRLKEFTARFKLMPISFQTLGIFPNTTVYTGPVVTRELLHLHSEVDGLLDGCCKWPAFDYYRPGKWIPHCTLAMEFEANCLNDVLAIASHLKLPLNGQIVGLGVIEFRPVKHLFAFNLGEK